MKKLTAIAATLVVALTPFAAYAHDAPRDGGKIMAEALAAAKKKEPAAKKHKASNASKRAVSNITRRSKRVAHTAKGLPGVKVDRMKTASIGKAATRHRRTAASDVAAGTSRTGQSSTHAYGGIIDRYAKEYGIAPSLARAVIQVESGYNAHKTGHAGEVGLMQIKPATARMLGYSGSVKHLYSPETNIKWGMKYLGLAQDVGNGTTCGTLLKYNAGHAARRMNPVSAAYCGRVKAELADAAT